MILLIKEDRTMEIFAISESCKGELLALYGEENSYIVRAENLIHNMAFGHCFTGKLPMVYDLTLHGEPTECSLRQFAISVKPIAYADKDSKGDLELMFRIIKTTEKCSLCLN